MYRLLLLTSLSILVSPAYALKSDSSQPVEITSSTQSVDLQKNIITFNGNVSIKQGSINIIADRVVVTRAAGEDGAEVIEAFGQPVRFSQQLENGKPVKGRGQKLRYELKTERLELSEKAFLEQQSSSINSDKITYLVKEQKMEASSRGKNQVTTILVPAQLQNQ